jgi:HK97 family phage major capsid protein
MQKVLEFRAKLRALKEEGNVLLGKIDVEKRTMTVDEKNRFDSINSEMDATESRMDSYVKLNRISDEELRGAVATPQAKPNKPSFRHLGEQLIAVANFYTGRGQDSRLLEMRAASGLNEGTPSEGGFLVQTDFSSELLRNTYETNEIPNRCRRIGISGNSNNFSMNIIDETSRASGSRWGGIQVYRLAEAAAKTASKPKFAQINLKLEKLAGLCYATDENLQDASQLGAIIQQGFTEEFGFKLSDEIIRGDGAGKCLGILNSPALVTVNKEAGQTADTVITENILKMWKSRMGRNLVWIYNQEIEDQLRMLTMPIGTGGVLMPLYTSPTMPGGWGSILGAPALSSEVASGAGDVGDIILADLSQYLLIDKGGIQTAESIHVLFLTDETTFRFVYRVNGQPMAKNKITPYKRTDTSFYMSPFITLQAR